MVGPAQLRSWRRRLALSEEQCRLRHAAFCAKYPAGHTDLGNDDDDDDDAFCAKYPTGHTDVGDDLALTLVYSQV